MKNEIINESIITNNNSLNLPSLDNYSKFNDFIFSNDLKLTGKFLHRFEFFLKTKDLPGDIVEIGVFKGSGICSFLKFIQIFQPNSNKKIIGFDIFSPKNSDCILDKDNIIDKKTMNVVYNRVSHSELSIDSVLSGIKNTDIDPSKFLLIEGDIEETMPIFIKENPGFRASMIYIDVDLERPTYFSLIHLWDRLLPGGVILFDEYEYHKFTESNGVERFLKERNIAYELKSTNWIAPTAFLIKKGL